MTARDDASGGDPAPATLSLRLRLERLQDLDGGALRVEWRRLCRSEPPRISRDLLLRAIAYCLQEFEFGGLPKWAQRSLAGPTTGSGVTDECGAPVPKPAEPRLKPGARLVREWRGGMHSVVALDDAFEFEGRRYRSLTQIAREITGAHWSGPRFFGLMKRRAASESDAAPIPATEARWMSGFAQLKQGSASIEARPEIGGADGSEPRHTGRRATESADG
jgi:hypothetical protein